MEDTIGQYKFVVKEEPTKIFFYEITKPTNEIVSSNETFDCEARARLAAIGHISLMEKGEL